MLNKLIGYFLLLIVFSCNKSGKSIVTIHSNEEVKEFIKQEQEANTLNKKIKEVNYQLNYFSSERMALNEIGDITHTTQVQFDSIIRNYDSLLFFNLQISIDNFNDDLLKYNLQGDAEYNYSQLIEYYAYKMQKDVCIVQNEKDTIPCVLYHYERSFGISPITNIMLGFKPKTISDLVLVYDNKHLKTGIVKFKLENKNIINYPHIKIS